MSDGTKIEWTDATWNPITGCSVISAGCKHCYAMKLAGTRLQHHPSRAGLTVDTKNGPVWTGEVRFNEQWLDQPMRWKRPRMVFVCAHADLFHPNVPNEWLPLIFGVMAAAKQHTFQVLTKRPERMREVLNDPVFFDAVACTVRDTYGIELEADDWPLRNVWVGVSVEDKAAADERIPLLLDTPAAVRWISAEPLLGPVDLNRILVNQERGFHASALHEQHDDCYYHSNAQLDWVVVGGESGPNARPMHPDWARSLRDQCAAAGVPFLFKQWGEWGPNWYNDDAGQKIDGSEWMDRMGKKMAGRLLDGVQHDGYPGSD